jgi:hypothetical protein
MVAKKLLYSKNFLLRECFNNLNMTGLKNLKLYNLRKKKIKWLHEKKKLEYSFMYLDNSILVNFFKVDRSREVKGTSKRYLVVIHILANTKAIRARLVC